MKKSRSEHNHNSEVIESAAIQPTKNIERVTILHDSLCRYINDTLLSREGIKTKKVWAPDFTQMNQHLDKADEVDTIVVQAVTREIPSKSAENINNDIDEIVEKALTKAKKVVLSTVVAREDKRDIQYKIDLINANLMYKYRENDEC